MRFVLEIPAWHHTEEGDKPSRQIRMTLENRPLTGDQIEIPDGGIVQVIMTRHRHEDLPIVFSEWRKRPEGAPVFRSRSVR